MQKTIVTTAPRGDQRRLGVARPRWGERFILGLLGACAALSVATTVGIVIALFLPSIEFFSEVSLREFFTTRIWSPLFARPKFGVLPLTPTPPEVTAAWTTSPYLARSFSASAAGAGTSEAEKSTEPAINCARPSPDPVPL